MSSFSTIVYSYAQQGGRAEEEKWWWTHNPPDSTSQLLQLQAWATTAWILFGAWCQHQGFERVIQALCNPNYISRPEMR